jgi:6-phosphogluconolactonase/glucosamine-6-phosphate isomerase/deaminase
MNKAKANSQSNRGSCNRDVPASALQLHHDVMVIRDKAAAVKLRDQKVL